MNTILNDFKHNKKITKNTVSGILFVRHQSIRFFPLQNQFLNTVYVVDNYVCVSWGGGGGLRMRW